MKICFLGGGNMASALIGGMLAKGFAASDIAVVERDETSRARLTERVGVQTHAALDAAALDCDVLVLAVKPQQMREAIAPAAGKLTHQVVVSIAAGLRLGDLARWLGNYSRLVRCMPNTPALIGAGVTGLFADPSVSAEARDIIERILASVGQTVWIDSEAQMDAVTALSGSGPAYVFHFIEAMEAAGVSMGFDTDTARKLAIGTVLGAAQLAAGSDESPAVLRERVTSKGGTTAAALAVMAEGDLIGLVGRAIDAAAARGKALGDELGAD
ncbi:pyrroline-5-carboxylate reductase [Denitromonas iodatirespirans]|uniref:Pyrroline-5-carboxylate reductase n=1 Tax=Denitromonas iodatirespirans TaxID=2795389 RepID=A0A944DJ11_DENI1|nr:pyrroline-5-carboxylate reductase [Denitromonas iodatirespirans]MBT0959749.1 pyrroline-5-carboxylate reductase [Denitromonas iodatirespirans]